MQIISEILLYKVDSTSESKIENVSVSKSKLEIDSIRMKIRYKYNSMKCYNYQSLFLIVLDSKSNLPHFLSNVNRFKVLHNSLKCLLRNCATSFYSIHHISSSCWSSLITSFVFPKNKNQEDWDQEILEATVLGQLQMIWRFWYLWMRNLRTQRQWCADAPSCWMCRSAIMLEPHSHPQHSLSNI